MAIFSARSWVADRSLKACDQGRAAAQPVRRKGTAAMPSNFDLILTADTPSRAAELRLLDAHGTQLAYRQADFNSLPASRLQGLFDLRNYLRLYVEEGKEEASVAGIGVCIAEEILGEEIFRLLWASESQRTLRIQLPGATEEENLLAAALARVPWEIARAAPDLSTLSERNLLVRVVHDMAAPATQPLELGEDECLRILFVFAESRGSHPLAARKERRALLRLFEKEIYPQRRVEAHFLTHGVTRERLESQIQENSGYHIVHWSGHGNLNLLELAKPGGAQDLISGEALLDLFTDAGGFIPHLPQRLPLRGHPAGEGLERLPGGGPGEGAGHEGNLGREDQEDRARGTAGLYRHRPRPAPRRRALGGRHALCSGRRVRP
jgi:hypothetical protein